MFPPLGEGGEDPVEDEEAHKDGHEADTEADGLEDEVRGEYLPDHEVAAQDRRRQHCGEQFGSSGGWGQRQVDMWTC